MLDYGSGNLFSISSALRKISSDIVVKISSVYKPGTTDGLVLPGVGSFTSGQKILRANKSAILHDIEARRTSVLGICLGMQLLFESSEEGEGTGLGIFKGNVVKFANDASLKVPHMGWNTINLTKESRLCKGVRDDEWVYFVHSFYPIPNDNSIVKAWTKYGKQRFASVVEQKNIFGTQFHPEKSQATGVKLLSNYIQSVKEFSRGQN